MKKNFTLIELIIVIGILGTLTALIIPSFSSSEKEAKEATDAYNSRGIVRYVHMFENANDAYPSGFHTGLSEDGTAPLPLPESFGVEEGELEDDAPVEIVTLVDSDADDNAVKYITSLKEAGINYLTAGEVPEAKATALKDSTVSVKALKVKTDHDDVKDMLFAGRKLSAWVKPEQFEMGEHADNGIVVALFITPNVDWETVYKGGYHAHDDHGHFEEREKSKIALKNTPVSNVSTAEFKYYCCLFKLYKNGSPATLVGAVSPELTVVE